MRTGVYTGSTTLLTHPKHMNNLNFLPLAPVLFGSVTHTPNNTHHPKCSNDKVILFVADILLTLVGLVHSPYIRIENPTQSTVWYLLCSSRQDSIARVLWFCKDQTIHIYSNQHLRKTKSYPKITHCSVTENTTNRNSLFFYQARILLGCSCIASHANARGCLTDLFGSLAGGLCIVHVEVHVQNHGEHHEDCSGNEHSFAQRLTGPVTSVYHIPILGVVCVLCCSSN